MHQGTVLLTVNLPYAQHRVKRGLQPHTGAPLVGVTRTAAANAARRPGEAQHLHISHQLSRASQTSNQQTRLTGLLEKCKIMFTSKWHCFSHDVFGAVTCLKGRNVKTRGHILVCRACDNHCLYGSCHSMRIAIRAHPTERAHGL